jgi:hypothetical protein
VVTLIALAVTPTSVAFNALASVAGLQILPRSPKEPWSSPAAADGVEPLLEFGGDVAVVLLPRPHAAMTMGNVNAMAIQRSRFKIPPQGRRSVWDLSI